MNFRLVFVLGLVFLAGCKKEAAQKTDEKLKTPNVLVIVADDMGFSDIGSYGGNIQTPVLDQLSKESLSFTNFHVQPTCSPTRASLLTGNDNHVAGLGIMSEMNYPELQAQNLPAYAGALSNQVVTIPEILKTQGYHTYMTGKWHLGEGKGKDPFDRGFEETFILGTGGGSHSNDKKALSLFQHMDYTRNGVSVELPESFYSTTSYTDSMIKFIDKNKLDTKPFFAYLSYTAVHDPLQAPQEFIDKYKGKFDAGWDSLWMERFNNLKSLGIIAKTITKFKKNPMIPQWKSLSADQQKEFARDMEVYAAMLDYMDMSIGRVFVYLKKEGLYDNTMIVFMSDNGANGAVAATYPGNGDGKYLASFNNELSNRGLKGSFVEAGPGWAQASTAPFRLFKGFTAEGGIKAPLMVKMPGNTKNAGQWNRSFTHVTDLMPTLLELTGASYPQEFKGNKIHACIGKSLLPILKGDSTTVHTNHGMGWELFEMKAYIKGDWKILRLPQPMASGAWELYNLKNDPTELTDLSVEFPDIKNQLIKEWEVYAVNNQVIDHKGHYDEFYRRKFSPKGK